MKRLLTAIACATMLVGGCTSAKASNVNQAAAPIVETDSKNVASASKPSLSVNLDNNEELDWLSKSILDSGTSFLKSGISSLAEYAFKAACAEMGIDIRDAQTKKLDQIIEQLDKISLQVKQGIEELTKKAQQVQDSTTMNEVIGLINDVKSPVIAELKILEDIARKENDPNYDKESLKQQKETFVDEFEKKLNFKSLSNQVWHTTELLAIKLANPNQVKKSQTLMDLYDNTLGANDVWDYQSYFPRIKFIQECSFLLNSLAILAKLDASREISKYQPGDSNIEGVKSGIEDMCKAVNNVNGIFQKELQKLGEIKARHDDENNPTMSHLKRTFDKDGFVHISTDYTVSAYLATVSVDDVCWQNTVADFYNDGYSHCFKTFVADDTFYQTVYNDYSFYASNYQVDKGYDMKQYLKDLGFKVPASRQKDFDDAIGIYKNIDVSVKGRGFLRGRDYYAYYNYYDWNGKLSKNDFCRVGETFWNNYDDETVYKDNIDKKMITFVNQDNQHLLGTTYYTIAQRCDKSSSQLINHFYRGNKTNDDKLAPYKVN